MRLKDEGPKVRACFKRMETDGEYAERLVTTGVPRWMVHGYGGAYLDNIGDHLTPPVQRRIVEDVA